MNVKTSLQIATRVGVARAIADARADRRNLIVVRESQKYDLDLLLNMGQQTLEPVKHLPGVDGVLQILADPTRGIRFLMGQNAGGGMVWLRSHDGIPLRQRGRIYGWRFQVAGTHFLFAASSAMSDEEEDLDNPFSADLMAAIEQIRPHDLWAGPFTRLVRRKMLGEMLGEKCRRRKVTVHVKEVSRGITLDDMTGDMIWSMWCQMAEADLKMTVTRMFTGKLYGSKRGEWAFDPGYLPPNAALTGSDKRIVSREELARLEERPLTAEDDRALAEARLTVELAAEAWDLHNSDTPLTSTEFLRRLSDDPGVQARIRHHVATHRGAPLTKLKNHDAAVRDRLKMVPVMLEGEYLQLQGLPLAGITEDDLHGWPVYKHDVDNEQEKGFTVLSWTMPKLEGIDTDVADKAVRYAELIGAQQRDRGLGVIGEQDMLPLTSLWVSTAPGRPERRLVSTTGVGVGYVWKELVRADGFSFHADSEVVGKFSLASFNREFIAAIEQLLADDRVDLASIAVNVAPRANAPAASDEELEQLRTQRGEVHAVLEAYRVSANASRQAAAALGDLIGDAELHLARLDRDIELRAAQSIADAGPGAVDDGFVGTLADLCALTEMADQPLPAAINRAWREVLWGATVCVAVGGVCRHGACHYGG